MPILRRREGEIFYTDLYIVNLKTNLDGYFDLLSLTLILNIHNMVYLRNSKTKNSSQFIKTISIRFHIPSSKQKFSSGQKLI